MRVFDVSADDILLAAIRASPADGGSRDNATCVVVAFDTPTDTVAPSR